MKVTGKIFSITFLLFLLCISPISAFANEKLYQGYFENIKISGDEPSVLLRITDGKLWHKENAYTKGKSILIIPEQSQKEIIRST